ncbi:hypothetical protein SprV_0200704300 [Sparganum proliferum]
MVVVSFFSRALGADTAKEPSLGDDTAHQYRSAKPTGGGGSCAQSGGILNSDSVQCLTHRGIQKKPECNTDDTPRSNRPERRTALVARGLARCIASLSETRFSKQSQLEDLGAAYTFFWSGRPKAGRRDAGVAFAIRNDIV